MVCAMQQGRSQRHNRHWCATLRLTFQCTWPSLMRTPDAVRVYPAAEAKSSIKTYEVPWDWLMPVIDGNNKAHTTMMLIRLRMVNGM
jgi:hypothetical protein